MGRYHPMRDGNTYLRPFAEDAIDVLEAGLQWSLEVSFKTAGVMTA